MVKNILIFTFIVLGMVVILNFSDHNLKRAVDACLAGSQKLSKSKIVDLEEAKKFIKDEDYARMKKIGMWSMKFEYPWDYRKNN